VQLSPGELGQRAQILKPPISLKDVFKGEIVEIDNRERREKEAVEEMEKKRAKEKERGRIEIIIERPNKETIHDLVTLPMCTRTPRMLIIGKIVACKKFALCTNGPKYLHQQRSKMR
jgi:hypothetical protein